MLKMLLLFLLSSQIKLENLSTLLLAIKHNSSTAGEQSIGGNARGGRGGGYGFCSGGSLLCGSLPAWLHWDHLSELENNER